MAELTDMGDDILCLLYDKLGHNDADSFGQASKSLAVLHDRYRVCFRLLPLKDSLTHIKRLEDIVFFNAESLRCVSLYRCHFISDRELNLLAQCTGLNKIDVAWCPRVTDYGLVSLFHNCKKLAAIRISGCQNIRGTCFNQPLPTLGYIEATHCSFDISAHLINLSGIHYLNVACPLTYPCGDGLGALGNGLAPHLTTLDISDCVQVDDNAITTLSAGCQFIVKLNLSGCYRIGDLGWAQVPFHCQHLSVLYANRCLNLSDFGLFGLGLLGHNLSLLSISRCCQITPQGIENFNLIREHVTINKQDAIHCILPSEI